MTEKLFFDTDCISSFLWINDTNIIENLYGGKIVFPEQVYQEMSNPCIPHIKQRADALLTSNAAMVMALEVGTEEFELYTKLINGKEGKKAIGHGEAGGIALAKRYGGILASNNYKDISPYIQEYGLRHIDTGIILKEALAQRLITEADGNRIWSQMLKKKRMLPAESFTKYLRENGRQIG